MSLDFLHCNNNPNLNPLRKVARGMINLYKNTSIAELLINQFMYLPLNDAYKQNDVQEKYKQQIERANVIYWLTVGNQPVDSVATLEKMTKRHEVHAGSGAEQQIVMRRQVMRENI